MQPERHLRSVAEYHVRVAGKHALLARDHLRVNAELDDMLGFGGARELRVCDFVGVGAELGGSVDLEKEVRITVPARCGECSLIDDVRPLAHGLARALVANAVHGVTQGFKKDLDIVGVGYRAELKGKTVNFALGYSHPVEFAIPEGIQITVEKQTHLTVSGADRGRVGQVSADIRALRPPDPYKQKGIRITGERLKKKAGKAGAAKTGA